MRIAEIAYQDLKALVEKAGPVESRYHARRGVNEIYADGKLLAIEVMNAHRLTSRYFSDTGLTS